MNVDKGYVEAPIEPGIDLVEEIKRLKREKNAVILGHYYQRDEIQAISDFVGDSLALAQYAAKTDADIIVSCGVNFMGETAKILSPDKKVLVPDLNAGCSLADSCDPVEFKKFIDANPGHVVISYANTTAEVKALTDVIVTSSNATRIVESFPKDQPRLQVRLMPLQDPDFLHQLSPTSKLRLPGNNDIPPYINS